MLEATFVFVATNGSFGYEYVEEYLYIYFGAGIALKD